ncbi:hypothetical protein [Streptomyces sp. 6N223]|uniref:hypothetical protein n=1 Tax=Streptomyces sp. 6N223 TaxID=3457412 RepID=UPI003FD2C315
MLTVTGQAFSWAVFFLDLPTENERREIITVHLRKRRRGPQAFDVHHLARDTDDAMDAMDAMDEAFNEDRDVTTDDISRAADRTVPLSTSQRETIQGPRVWLREGRAHSASYAGTAEAATHPVPVLEV